MSRKMKAIHPGEVLLNLQAQYDLHVAADLINGRLEREVAVRVA